MADQEKDPKSGDQGNDPLWVASDEEVLKQILTFQTRLRKLCLYQHKEQRLSAQVITAVLLDLGAEVAGQWWDQEFNELLDDLEQQYPEETEEDSEDD